MSSSDDEAEIVPHEVLNYYFVDKNDEPVSFTELPVHWSDGDDNGIVKDKDDDENLNGDVSVSGSIFLHGTSNDGLQKIYKQVTAWKFDIWYANPEISVYSKDKKWIKLVKPRKSFETIIRSVLITVQCLHYLKHHPEASKKALWDHLAKVFSVYDVRPSENDLLDNKVLITEVSKRDEILRASEMLNLFLKENPKKRKDFDEVGPSASMSTFIVDDTDDVLDDIEEDESEEEDYDSVCAFCDNGGTLLCCEGSCMRSFHPTVESGSDSLCVTLGFTPEQVERMPTFFCPHCQQQRHQCFFCGKLGSSDKSAGAEVFRCVKATCGRFYHPKCVSKLLHKGNEASAQQLEGEISNGKSFMCPVHKCCMCGEEENKKVKELQFAICRRCPKSYHRKCLPREIRFDFDEETGLIQRAWEDLLPNRILIYCLKHEIDEELGTPARNHLKFNTVEERRKKHISELQPSSSREKFLLRRKISDPSKSRVVADTDSVSRSLVKPCHSVDKTGSILRKGNKPISGFDPLRRRAQGTSVPKKLVRGPLTHVTEKADKSSTAGENKMSLGDQLFQFYSKAGSHENILADEAEAKTAPTPEFKLNAESQKRIEDIMKKCSSKITLEKIIEKHKGPSTHSFFSREAFDRTVTQGKVDAAVMAIRSALEKLDSGASVQEAKTICEPKVLTNVAKWKDKLKVYLAPFLHGTRYTSFGRHFTKVDKLEQIVDRLHCYVRNGDMIVDFCCGSNDFSCILKRKLEETGKKCSFKNFDIIQAKNDFNFVQKDWFEVTANELPSGSRLIMGLNPPFGVKASLANKFIDKALEFKPKMLILIVPPETQRLDEKKIPYDLIWEDSELLSGKAFYLPGSVDENNKQLDDWNLTTPPLYLWSRQDWTNKAKEIAEKHGHVSRKPNQFRGQESNNPQKYVAEPPRRTEGPERPASREVTAKPGSQKPSPCGHGGHSNGRTDHKDGSTKDQGGCLTVDGARELGKNSSDIPRKSFNSRERQEEKNGDQDHYKAQSEEPGGMEQQNSGRYFRSDRQTSDLNPRLDRSSSERYLAPADHRSTSDRYASGYERELSSQAPHNFQPDHGSGVPGFGRMDTDLTNDIARLYSYNDRMFSPGPDGLGYPYVNEINGRETEMRSLIQNYGRQETDMRSLIQNYGRQDPDPFTNNDNYMPNHDPSFNHFNSMTPAPYNSFGPAASDAPYNRLNSSTMERYAPRLDELNHTRVNNGGMDIQQPPLGARSDNYDPRTGQQQQAQAGPRSGSLGFAYGSPQTFAQSSSSGGWID